MHWSHWCDKTTDFALAALADNCCSCLSHTHWSPVSIQTQSLALRALRKRKPQETQALALESSQSWLPLLRPSIPIGWRLRLLRERAVLAASLSLTNALRHKIRLLIISHMKCTVHTQPALLTTNLLSYSKIIIGLLLYLKKTLFYILEKKMSN